MSPKRVSPSAMTGFYLTIAVIAGGASFAGLLMVVTTISGSPETFHHHRVWVSHWRTWEWLPLVIGVPCAILAIIGVARESYRG